MSELARVLFVDDEPQVLIGVTRALRGRYEVAVAASGADALQQLTSTPFAVIVSDMRMPGMDGAELLQRTRQMCPETVRVIMSGQADLEASVRAINDGQIFRFLLKPMGRDALAANVESALTQYRLITAEHELLERTLTGAVEALAETLALTAPLAFGRAARLRQVCVALAEAMKLPRRWTLEVAATLSQLGAATVPPATLKRWFAGEALTDGERLMVQKVPALTCQLLAHIPRLEPVCELLSLSADAPSATLPLEARVFQVAGALEARLGRDDLERALATLRDSGRYDPVVLDAATTLKGLMLGQGRARSVPISGVLPGMMLSSDVCSKDGALLLSRGHVVTDGVLAALRNFAHTVGLREPIDVLLSDDV
jgi:CheY-like chemotaxis protein